ncbi:MAG: hypothetical protein JEY94_18125 [Melioribacteraceae bacterium]|nr:hypothetical protein [Melioribacteraceae bacterium]
MKIYKKIKTLESTEKINGWIYNIANNTVIDYYRTKKIMIELIF